METITAGRAESIRYHSHWHLHDARRTLDICTAVRGPWSSLLLGWIRLPNCFRLDSSLATTIQRAYEGSLQEYMVAQPFH